MLDVFNQAPWFLYACLLPLGLFASAAPTGAVQSWVATDATATLASVRWSLGSLSTVGWTKAWQVLPLAAVGADTLYPDWAGVDIGPLVERGVGELLRWLLASLLLLVLLVAGLLAFTLYTQTGLRWTLAALQAGLPVTLEIGAIDGRLAGPLTVTDLDYRDESLELRISRITLDWQPAKLLERELQISVLQLGNVGVVTAAAPQAAPPPATEPVTLPDIRLPLAIRVIEASLDQLTIHDTDAAELFSAANIRTALSFDSQTLTLHQLEAKTSGVSLAVQGQLTPAANYPLTLSGHYSFTAEGFPALTGELAISGNLDRLQLQHHTLAPVSTELVATLTTLLDKPAWDASLQVQPFDTTTINPDWEPVTLQGSVGSQGSFDEYRFELETRLGGARIPAGNWSLSGTGTPQTVDVHTLHGDTPAGVISGRLRVEDVLAKPRWDAALQIGQLDTTRLDPEWEALTLDGSLRSQGSLDAYSFELDARITGDRIPAGQWSVAGVGNARAVDVQTLRGETLAEIQKVMTAETGDAGVDSVFFTSFVMQ